jgi:hypothetical protein
MDSKNCAVETGIGIVLGALAGKILAKEIPVAKLNPKDWLDSLIAKRNMDFDRESVGILNKALGCGGIECFVAGTPVMTPEGLKAIELIQVGELVQARNELTGETKWQRVEEIIISHDREVWDYTFADDSGTVETIGATPVHPFHIPGGEWIEVGKLSIGQQVSSLDWRVLVLQSKAIRETGQTTYNFEIAEDHNYFVGTIGAWVHNGAGDCVVCPGFSLALGLSSHPNHGYNGLVGKFADHVNANTYWDLFENTTDMRQMGNNLLQGMRGAEHIHFNLDGLIRPGFTINDVRRFGSEGIGHGNVTAWELDQVLKNPAFSSKATFYLNGKPVDIGGL